MCEDVYLPWQAFKMDKGRPKVASGSWEEDLPDSHPGRGLTTTQGTESCHQPK